MSVTSSSHSSRSESRRNSILLNYQLRLQKLQFDAEEIQQMTQYKLQEQYQTVGQAHDTLTPIVIVKSRTEGNQSLSEADLGETVGTGDYNSQSQLLSQKYGSNVSRKEAISRQGVTPASLSQQNTVRTQLLISQNVNGGHGSNASLSQMKDIRRSNGRIGTVSILMPIQNNFSNLRIRSSTATTTPIEYGSRSPNQISQNVSPMKNELVIPRLADQQKARLSIKQESKQEKQKKRPKVKTLRKQVNYFFKDFEDSLHEATTVEATILAGSEKGVIAPQASIFGLTKAESSTQGQIQKEGVGLNQSEMAKKGKAHSVGVKNVLTEENTVCEEEASESSSQSTPRLRKEMLRLRPQVQYSSSKVIATDCSSNNSTSHGNNGARGCNNNTPVVRVGKSAILYPPIDQEHMSRQQSSKQSLLQQEQQLQQRRVRQKKKSMEDLIQLESDAEIQQKRILLRQKEEFLNEQLDSMVEKKSEWDSIISQNLYACRIKATSKSQDAKGHSYVSPQQQLSPGIFKVDMAKRIHNLYIDEKAQRLRAEQKYIDAQRQLHEFYYVSNAGNAKKAESPPILSQQPRASGGIISDSVTSSVTMSTVEKSATISSILNHNSLNIVKFSNHPGRENYHHKSNNSPNRKEDHNNNTSIGVASSIHANGLDRIIKYRTSPDRSSLGKETSKIAKEASSKKQHLVLEKGVKFPVIQENGQKVLQEVNTKSRRGSIQQLSGGGGGRGSVGDNALKNILLGNNSSSNNNNSISNSPNKLFNYCSSTNGNGNTYVHNNHSNHSFINKSSNIFSTNHNSSSKNNSSSSNKHNNKSVSYGVNNLSVHRSDSNKKKRTVVVQEIWNESMLLKGAQRRGDSPVEEELLVRS